MIFDYLGYFSMVLVYLWNKEEINMKDIFFNLNIWVLYCSQKYCLIFVARDICFSASWCLMWHGAGYTLKLDCVWHSGALRHFPWQIVICLLPYSGNWKWWDWGCVEKQRGLRHPCVFVSLNLVVCTQVPGWRRHVQVNLLQANVLDYEGNLVTQCKKIIKLWVINTFSQEVF